MAFALIIACGTLVPLVPLSGADRPPIMLENALLAVETSPADGALTVTDKRTGTVWRQQAVAATSVLELTSNGRSLRLGIATADAATRWQAEISLDPVLAEVRVTLRGDGPLAEKLAWPHPFATGAGTSLIVPMSEGVSFPVEDPHVPALRLPAYSGHGLSMPFFGVTDGEAAQLALVETPDDFALGIARLDGRLRLVPEWEPQRGNWGEARTVRYVFFDRGGFVAMCKYYRRHASARGLLRTLAEKRRENKNVDLLVGAANIWCRGKDALPIAREMIALGMTRLLWNDAPSGEQVKALNALGLLTGSYDIYKDVMDPAVHPKLHKIHPLWTNAAWPDDLVLDAAGNWVRGWRVTGRDGVEYPCGNVCDLCAVKYARERIPADLREFPKRARFLDTVTATTLFECYHPAHPTTRTQSKHGRIELLRYVSADQRLVTGAENGMDFAAPYVHYFEGMMSLDAFRVPQSGRAIAKIWTTVPDDVGRFQVGHAYRLPLWELVYHDCVVAHWYWGDYNNKLTPIWKQRDLFNILYGTPPLYMFNDEIWAREKERFARSYHDIVPVVRAVGYAEMIDLRFLTPDRSVQQSRFDNGVSVTVNFGESSYLGADGTKVPALGFTIGREPRAAEANVSSMQSSP